MGISGRFFNTVACVYGVTYASTDTGSTTTTMSLTCRNLPCYVTQVGGTKSQFGNQDTPQMSYRMFCNPINVKSNDRVYITKTDDWYQVITVDPCSGLNHHYEIALERIAAQDVSEAGEA